MNGALLDEGLQGLGLVLPSAARDRLLAYAGLLLKWNRVYNLTAIRDPQQAITHHLLDSLAVVPHLQGVTRLLDVGSGGGLPGIPLAICLPALQVHSVETVGKKASFQQQARIELGLDNFSVSAARVENLPAEPGFDGVISRAFSSLEDFTRLTRHLLVPGGRWFAMKGLYPADELAALPPDVRLLERIRLTVPGLEAERNLLILGSD
ncbi:MAG: 16S rRNA (guanine(527)-N(7))-methyltransferase RsmG [Rhodocyclaceae bacterium]